MIIEEGKRYEVAHTRGNFIVSVIERREAWLICEFVSGKIETHVQPVQPGDSVWLIECLIMSSKEIQDHDKKENG